MKDYKLLLDKFWRGSATETEKLQLYKVMVEDEEALRLALQQEFETIDGKVLQPDASKRILESLHKEIGVRASNAIEMPRKSPELFKWAAAVFIIGFASFFAWKFNTPQSIVTNSNTLVSSNAVIENTGTAVKNITLNDGTNIRLYPNSTLKFKQPFNSQNIRSIDLTGKANFKVKHNALKPFEVIANNIKTTDIGTEFCIDASDKNTFKIVLKEGSIHVATMPNSGITMEDRILKPGEELRCNFADHTTAITQVSPKNVSGRMAQSKAVYEKERLVFDKTPLNSVFAKLETREHVSLKFKEEDIKELTFTGVIESTDNIETALNIICNLNGLSYHKTNQLFVVSKNK